MSNYNENIEIDKNYFSILTIGRLTKEKGPELAVKACKKLIDEGFDVKWYWVGDGNQANYIRNIINELGIEGSFYLLGNKNNPYIYIKKCDIYVQPSKYEAYCTTTNEARILNKPIVTTNVGGMKDQFVDKETALIVNPDEDSIYNAIKILINDEEYRNKLVFSLKQKDYKFEDYINEYNKLFL